MRLKSLDALRGLDMLFLCGLSAVCRGFCKLFPGGEEWAFYSQFAHVRWEGLHFEDLIFPFFIFIAGAAFPFSLARQVEKGMTSRAIHRKILVRLVALVLLGYVYNGHLLGGNYGKFHWWSVLGIIGFAWATAALCYVHFRMKARLAITVALLAGYWTLLQFTAPDAPSGAGAVSPAGNMMGYFKRQVCDYWILLSVVGYSSSAFFGMFATDIVRKARAGLTSARKSGLLAACGAFLLAAGLALEPTCPLVKNLWTPSYALVCGGLSFLTFALFYFLIDVKGISAWCFPLEVVGSNALVAYLLTSLVDFTRPSTRLFGWLANLCPTPDFVIACGQVLIVWTVLWYLHRNRTFLKV